MRGLNGWMLAGLIALGTRTPAAAEKFAAPDFATHVAPILQKYCVGCHGPGEANGGLELHEHALALKGGEHGPSIVPGKSGESKLILTIEGKAKPKMPPKNNPKPSAEELAVLKAWVDAGAKPPAKPSAAPVFAPPVIKPLAPPKQAVNAIAYSPKGDLLAIARESVVTLLEPSTGYIVRELAGHVGRVNAIRFSRDGATLVAAAGEVGLSGDARLWSVAEGKLRRAITGHRDCLYAIDLSADGKLLATAGYDKDIRIWDLTTGKERKVLSGHNDAVFELAFSPDARFVASASGDRTVKLWDVASGERLDTFSQAGKDLYTLAYSPDGSKVAAAGIDNRIRVWRISATGKEGTNSLLVSRFAHQSPIIKLAFSADGKRLASSAEDRTVKIWQADGVREVALLETQADWPAALTFAPDGNTLAVGRHDGGIALYDPRAGKKTRDLAPAVKPPALPELASYLPRGVERGQVQRVTFAGKNLAGVSKINVSNPKLLAKLAGGSSNDQVVVDLTPAADLPRGRLEISFVTPGGTTRPAPIEVDNLPQRVEHEPNDAPAQATATSIPFGAWGTLAARGDADHYAFDAKKDQSIVLELVARSMGSKINAVVTVMDQSGRVIATGNDADGQRGDPVVAFKAPTEGRYVARVSDLRINGSAEHFYRLSVGEFPFVTGIYPLGRPAKAEVSVELVGHNLPVGSKAVVKTGGPGAVGVPIDPERFRFNKSWALEVGSLPSAEEAEPNGDPAVANRVTIPATIEGRIHAEGGADQDLFRFVSEQGATWIIETEAFRRGAPTDTRIEILTGEGKPIERVWLQAVRDSAITFRGVLARAGGARLVNWDEMDLNQLLYIRGEVVKLFRMPQGPDSEWVFYPHIGGLRQTLFDTTATTHAVEDPCYIVEAHPPGTKLLPNGLPLFKLTYRNDDASDRRLGSDSRLTFMAPADGEYLVRVTETRGQTGPGHAYRLTIRQPNPDFVVSVGPGNPSAPVGSGREISFTVDRSDGFDGDVTIDVEGLPPGFRLDGPITIAAGKLSAQAVLFADEKAPAPTKENAAAARLTARAQINGATVVKPVAGLGTIGLAPKAKLRVRLEPAVVTIAPGGQTTARLIIDRDGFTDRVQFQVNNLPHGVIVDNIGLNGILIPPGQNERQIFLTARGMVAPTRRPFHAVAQIDGAPASAPILLEVQPSKDLASGAAP